MTRDRGNAGTREREAAKSGRITNHESRITAPRPSDVDTVIVLDFGAQYAQLIARRVREAKVRSLILPYDTPVDEIQALRPKGLILSGGPASVYEPGAPQCDPRIFDGRIPALGICYGMQLMAHELGGRTSAAGQREYGRTRLFVDDRADLFAGLEPRLMCWMSHGDSVVTLPTGFEALARTDHNPVAAMANRRLRQFGAPSRCRWCMWMRETGSSAGWPASSSRSRSAGPSVKSSSPCSMRRRESSGGWTSWCRAPYTRM